MESYRSPQVNPAMRISAPRSLRPRDQRHAAEPTTRYTPPATFPIIPVELFNGQPVNQTERAADPQRDLNEAGSSPSSDAESSIEPSSPQGRSRRFVGGFISGLRSIPQAMAKHNSRESLYAEYLAEAEAASRAASPRYRASTVLSDIPEQTMEPDRISQRLPPPEPFRPFANGPDSDPAGIVSSPTYTNSGLYSGSQYSKEPSIQAPLPPPDTWAYYARRIQLFVHNIWRLPWSSSRIVRDYVPARDGRGHYGERKPEICWYAPRGTAAREEKIGTPTPVIPEFFVVPPSPVSGSRYAGDLMPPRFPRGDGSMYTDDAATAVRPLQTPMTTTSAGYAFPSPGASSHGHGRHVASYSWYFSSPPAMFQPSTGQYQSEAASTPYTRTQTLADSLGMSP